MRKKISRKEKKWGRGEKNYPKQRLSAQICSPKESELQRQKCILHSESVVLLRYEQCIGVAERQLYCFFLFARESVRWSKRPTPHSVGPKLSGSILIIFKLLFRGYNVGLQMYFLFLKCKIPGFVLWVFSKFDITGLIRLSLVLK